MDQIKIYNSVGPNPKALRMAMAEKNLDAKLVEVDLLGGENRRDPFLAKNPYGGLPLLELDTGNVVAEVPVIVEFLEEIHPAPPLIGTTVKERADSRMWLRRVEQSILHPMIAGFRYSEGLKLFQSRMRCMPQAADDLKQMAKEGIAFLDSQMAGRDFIAGGRFTIGDVMLYSFLDFFHTAGQPFDRDLPAISDWYDRIGTRKSATA